MYVVIHVKRLNPLMARPSCSNFFSSFKTSSGSNNFFFDVFQRLVDSQKNHIVIRYDDYLAANLKDIGDIGSTYS